jgi:Protein of unknown function (DUF2971)
MAEVGQQPMLPKSRSLFHYTTAQGLIGIIRDQSLFATHAHFSNDSSECRLILPHLIKILASEYEEHYTRLTKLGVAEPGFLQEYGRGVFESEATRSAGAMLKATNKIAPYFITSFCIHDEDSYEYSNGLLSQWRSYARGGFAIEFDEFGIDALIKEESNGWRYQGIITNTVVYKDHEGHVKPERFKGMAGALLRTILMKKVSLKARIQKRRELDEILGKADVEDFALPFLSVAPFLKHNSFNEECEYRIVALCNRPDISDQGDERQVKEICFGSRAGGDIGPYIALFSGLGKPLPIKSIIVGPHARQENQHMAVELLLERYGTKASVRLSESPFRE